MPIFAAGARLYGLIDHFREAQSFPIAPLPESSDASTFLRNMARPTN